MRLDGRGGRAPYGRKRRPIAAQPAPTSPVHPRSWTRPPLLMASSLADARKHLVDAANSPRRAVGAVREPNLTVGARQRSGHQNVESWLLRWHTHRYDTQLARSGRFCCSRPPSQGCRVTVETLATGHASQSTQELANNSQTGQRSTQEESSSEMARACRMLR